MEEEPMIRLDKYLADMGVGTRSEAKRLIRQGKVTADGAAVKSPEYRIDETSACVRVEGNEISYIKYEYYMLNKPAGVVSATEDPKEKTVLELITGRKHKGLFPVGRLDKDTEGLLLITNDGALAHRFLSPKKHVDKTYYARVKGLVTKETVRQFSAGMDIGKGREERTMPAKLRIIQAGEISEVRLVIQEGKYHQVKRMFQAVGMEVLYLKREAFGGISLDEALPPGGARRLTKEELGLLNGRETDGDAERHGRDYI